MNQALRAGVATRPLSLYALARPAPAKGLQLGCGAVREEEVAPNFAQLARVVQAFRWRQIGRRADRQNPPENW